VNGSSIASRGDRAGAFAQRLLPQRAIARCVHALARTRISWVKNALIRAFVSAFKVDMRDSAIVEATAYPSFNAFFTRALAIGSRRGPAAAGVLAGPVDGTVSAAGSIDGEALLQAKGHPYSLSALLAGDSGLAGRFRDGAFATLYLAPHNYHRIHMPLAGTLQEMLFVPGSLYSVNAATERAIPGLFARNERVVCLFETVAGPMAVILVGALIVGSMETVWHGEVRARPAKVTRWRYDSSLRLERGDELGRFNVGSTVIVLCAQGRVRWDDAIRAGAQIRVGQPFGVIA
jgi:phosphatidylserine decarboxylase